MFSSFTRPVLKSLSFTTGRGFATNLAEAVKTNGNLSRRLGRVDAVVRNNGRVPTRDFLAGLEEMMQPGTEVTPIQGLLMLRCCGSLLQEETKERRNEIAEKTWSALIDREVKLDISHYNALLRIYLENSKPFDPIQFLEDLESRNIQPNRVTYQRIIHHFCSSGQMEATAKLLLMLKERNVPLTDTIFNSLLMGHLKASDFDGYKSTLKMMTASGIEPTDETFNIVLSAAAEMSSTNNQFVDIFNEIYNEAQSRQVTLSDEQLLEIASHLPETQAALFDQLISTCFRDENYNIFCYNAILTLVNSKKIDFAFKLLKTMSRKSSSPEYQSGLFVVRQMVKSGSDLSEVKQLCERLKEEGLSDYGLSTAVEAAFDYRDLDVSRSFLKLFIEQREDKIGQPHFYWPLLAKCTSQSQTMDVLLNDMTSMDKLSPARSILETFQEYVWTKDIRDPMLLIDQLKSTSFSTSLLLTSLVNHHVQNAHLDEALNTLKKNTHMLVHPRFIAPGLASALQKLGNVNSFISILKVLRTMSADAQDDEWIGRCLLLYVNSGGNIPMQDLLPKMKGLPLSEAVVNTLKERNLLSDQDIDQLIPPQAFSYTRPDNLQVSPEALENHLIELRSKGMDTRGLVRRLVLAYCRKSNDEDSQSVIKRVKELLDELKSQNFTITPAMNASVMTLYANHGEIEKAMELRKIIPPQFVIDPFKILDLVTCLIKAGKKDDAVSLIEEELQVERPPKEESSQYSVERNVFKVLNAAAEITKDPKFVRSLLDPVLNLVNVTKPTNVMIGPLVKVHLLNDDVNGALEEFSATASNFNVTPWRAELMKKVIEMNDPNSLQLLTDISVKMHGEAPTLVSVAMAFIKAGKLQQAKKVMVHPSFSQAERSINQIAERCVTTNEIEALEKFVEAISQSGNKFDLDPLYFQLIRGYASRNDANRALEVWVTMQEKEVTPSSRTLRYLGSFLKESGVNVPFDYSNIGIDVDPPKASTEQSKKSSGKAAKRNGRQSGERKDRNLKTQGEQDNKPSPKKVDTIDEIIMKRRAKRSGQNASVSEDGNLISSLINANRRHEAVEILEELMQKKLYPAPRILRQLIGVLNQNGDVEIMERLKGKLPEEFKNQPWYTNQLAYCYVTAGQAEKLVHEVLPELKPVPFSAVTNVLAKNPELEHQVMDLAEKVFKDEDNHMIYNAIWTHRMISHNFDGARELCTKIPQLVNNTAIGFLINRIRLEKDVELAEALATVVDASEVVRPKLKEVLSAKMDALIDLDKVDEAEEHLMQVIGGSRVKLEDIKRMSLVRLKQKVIEVSGREPKFEIPIKQKQDVINHENDKH